MHYFILQQKINSHFTVSVQEEGRSGSHIREQKQTADETQTKGMFAS
jgi:hypothetical protein